MNRCVRRQGSICKKSLRNWNDDVLKLHGDLECSNMKEMNERM